MKNNNKLSKMMKLIMLSLVFALTACSSSDSNESSNSSLGAGVVGSSSSSEYGSPYIVIRENSSYGLIDLDGNTMLDSEYDSLSIYGDYIAANSGNYTWQLLNEDLEAVLDIEENVCDVTYNELYDVYVINDVLYDADLTMLSEEGYKINDDAVLRASDIYYYTNDETSAAGYMDYEGTILYEYIEVDGEESLFSISYPAYEGDEVYAVVLIDGLYGIVNVRSAEYIVDLQEYTLLNYSYGLFLVYDETDTLIQWYHINEDTVASEVIASDVCTISSNVVNSFGISYIVFCKDSDEVLVYDSFNEEYVEFNDIDYSSHSTFELLTDYLVCIDDFGNYGLTYQDEVIVDYEYIGVFTLDLYLFDYISNTFDQKLVFLREDMTAYKLYDLTSSSVVYDFGDSTAITLYDENDSLFIKIKNFDSSIESLMNITTLETFDLSTYDNLEIYENYFVLTVDGVENYYNEDFTLIYTIE